MAAVNEALLDEQLGELEKLRAWSPRLISKLETLVRTGDDWALFRANPYTFAEERGVGEEEAVDLFLLATKVGLFQATWSLLCPGCGAAVQSFASLRAVCSVFHCSLCSTDIETRLDDYVHVGFTISPRVRAVAAHDPDALSADDFHLRYHFTQESRVTPGGPRWRDLVPQMAKGMRFVEPKTVETFHFDVAPGELAACNIITADTFNIRVEPDAPGPNATLRLLIKDGKVTGPRRPLAPGPVTLEVENLDERRNSILVMLKEQAMIDATATAAAEGRLSLMHFDKFLSGRRLLTSQTFRQVFGTETIHAADGLGVRDISIVFTDLKGSTAMYDRIGDLKAFALVNQHFERLGRAIARQSGAVVKTIGDAVMASFESPANAVRAARQMLEEIEAFNKEVGEKEISLKVGVHRGASIAVTLNDRLDFFGQTVNIAARVQGLADSDEIYITEEVYRAPGVKELLGDLHVSAHEANLKGVQRSVSVYRVATGPAAAG